MQVADAAASLLRRLDAERAHDLAIAGLKAGFYPRCRQSDACLDITVCGLRFSNPIGMAAGFDKNGEVPDALIDLGFGFAEVGTVTPKRQGGNPKPRIFRLPDDRAVINRLGFNNDGHLAVRGRLAGLTHRKGVIGVNIGANKDSEDRIGDYVTGIEMFAAYADYFTVNISSPNTPGLRDLQARESLNRLLSRVLEARDRVVEKAGQRRPVWLKIAPDLDEAELDDIAAEAGLHALDGVVISNTTLGREGLIDKRHAGEAGGLSGKPLFERSTRLIAGFRKRAGPDLPLIGVGGVDSAETAFAKIAAGASLVQLYTGMIYKGPGLACRIARDLASLVKSKGFTSVADAVGTETDRWL